MSFFKEIGPVIDEFEFAVKTRERLNIAATSNQIEDANKFKFKCKENIINLVKKYDPRTITWSPDVISNQKLISPHVIDFCNNWNVFVAVISNEDFNKLNNLITPKNEKRLISFEDRLYGIDTRFVSGSTYTKAIYFSESFNPSSYYFPHKSNANSFVLHELCHILLKVNPKIISEFESPLYALWYMFMNHCDVKDHVWFTHENSKKTAMHLCSKKYSTFEEYINSFIPELKEIGLLHNIVNEIKFTYNNNKVFSKISWIWDRAIDF